MFVRKTNNGDYYVFRNKTHNRINGSVGRVKATDIIYDWFRGTISNKSGCSAIEMGHVFIPSELEGKKFRLKLEVIEEQVN